MAEKSIILFDGVCNLCNGFVNFIIPRDKNQNFQFGSLQSARGAELMQKFNQPTTELSTVVLIENDTLYSQSTAVLRIARRMGGAWSLLYVFMILPRFLRDLIYNLVARNRYRIFGRRESCMLPNPELASRFIG